MTVKKLQLKDFKKYDELNRDIKLIHHNELPSIFKKPIDASDVTCFSKKLEDDNTLYLGAFIDSVLVGYIVLEIKRIKNNDILVDNMVLSIESVIVDKDFRGKGIGKKLINKGYDYARENGITEIELTVWEFNEKALKLYLHEGFRPLRTKLRKSLDDSK